jgi:signal transduction histidine kinase
MDGFDEMLGRFAATMLGNTSTQAILDHAVRETAALLPIDGAGAVLLSTGAAPEHLAASDATAMEFELLQSSLNQGPCMVAHDTAMPVSIPDLDLNQDFPEFTAAARNLGLSGVFAFPLRQGEVSLGVLDLYRKSPGPLGEAEMLTAQVLADVLTAYVMNAQARSALEAAVERERCAARDLRSLSDERNDFVATLVHELGNPLASIAGFAEMLEQEPDELTDTQRHYIYAIHRNSDRLRALTTDLLALFRLGPEAVHGAYTEVDLRAVVAAVRGAVATAPETRAVDVVFLVPERPVVVHGHRGDLERMLSNLMSNALKYTPSGGTVTCALRQQDGHTTLEVRDTGIGIPEEEQGKLFTKFFRATTAKERGIQGTGLGLAIVKSVAHRHAGTIAVSSRVGGGTLVSVRLPVVREQSALLRGQVTSELWQ